MLETWCLPNFNRKPYFLERWKSYVGPVRACFQFQSNKEVRIKENLTDASTDSEFGVNQNHLEPCFNNSDAWLHRRDSDLMG